MFQTKKVSRNVVAVIQDATRILLRKSGRVYYGTEETAVLISDKKIIIDQTVVEKYGLSIELK